MTCASINGWIAGGLLILAVALVGIGLFFGFFGGINDGFWVGIKLFWVPACLAAGAVAASLGFRMAQRAHARNAPQRWWIQLAAVAIAWAAALLAVAATSLADRFGAAP